MAQPIQDLPGEIWKPVVGYEGFYEVSNHGRVRGLDRVRRASRGNGTTSWPGIIRKTPIDSTGYPVVMLYRYGARKKHEVHVLVLEAFVGLRPQGMVCCHNDGSRDNNRVENLRWDTHASNSADMELHGTRHRGETHHNSKLDADAVRAIRLMHMHGVRRCDIARQFGITPENIRHIVLRLTWRHVA